MCAVHMNGALSYMCVHVWCMCVHRAAMHAPSLHFPFYFMHLRTGHHVPLQVTGLSLSITHTHACAHENTSTHPAVCDFFRLTDTPTVCVCVVCNLFVENTKHVARAPPQSESIATCKHTVHTIHTHGTFITFVLA